jgi:hypothetical protein
MVGQLEATAQERIIAALGGILEDSCERRTEPRTPYFGPVTVGHAQSPQISLSAFVRDVSASGIGLVHLMPLKRGEVLIDLPLLFGTSVRLRTEIVWCRDYENGWYASGGRFMDVVT